MKKDIISDNDDMRFEYDFKKMSNGVQGKYYKAYRDGHTVKIHGINGTTLIQHFKLEDGSVMLEPDIRKYFPNSETVNKALRCLIPLVSNRTSHGEYFATTKNESL